MSNVLQPYQLHQYQKRAVDHQCSLPQTMMWMDVGLGKTAVTLTSIVHLRNAGFLRGTIVVAPKRVCHLVWRQEAAKWAHTKNLTFSVVMGSRELRTRALLRPADIYLINYENLGWLAETLGTYFIKKKQPIPFNGLVWDEISKMKNSTTERVKSFMRIASHFDWVTGLTGTPASNGYKDLHGQYLVVDKGARLGVYKTAFKTKFFFTPAGGQGTYAPMIPFKDTETTIKELIGDITLEMSAEDYNPLPKLIVNDIQLEMTGALREKYDQMERELFLHIDACGKDVEIFNQVALMAKCLAEGTEVLTYAGWKPIETVTNTDQVWDGIEWVNVSGIVCNGYKPVVNCWGVKMTPDHKVLTNQGWREAHEVLNGEPSEGLDRAAVRTSFSACESGQQGNVWDISASNVVGPLRLWNRISDTGSKPSQPDSTISDQVLRMLTSNVVEDPRDDQHSTMGDLAQYEITVYQSIRQGLVKLRRSWNQGLSGVARIVREVLGGNEFWLQRQVDPRSDRRERQLHERELSLGYSNGTREQQEGQCNNPDFSWSVDGCRSSEVIQPETDNDLQENRIGLARNDCAQTRVYDIINAGPRHRFTVRGENGEVFISHNCLQYGNGAIYPVSGAPQWEPIHDLKLDALEEILDEAQGNPVLCAYAYKSDAERIMKKFAHLNPVNLTECKSETALKGAMARWKSGQLPLLIGHPASMGHGIDGLQEAGYTTVWYGLTYNLDHYVQFNGRLRRQNQPKPVVCHRLMVMDTLDQVQAAALDDKSNTEAGLRRAIKEYRLSRGV